MPEPPPMWTDKSQAVWPHLERQLQQDEDLRRALESRVEFGRSKYGTVLHSHNGRNAIRDAKDEVEDLMFYLAQAHMEGKLENYEAALGHAKTLWYMLDNST